ncbi:MAG: hypothetical protein C5B53_06010 [Candidatus Melainabacteria bacterium]|nr:MAG: hypothetical protein C5B53_06010 [Candidatus Melainabacteria bacterium]
MQQRSPITMAGAAMASDIAGPVDMVGDDPFMAAGAEVMVIMNDPTIVAGVGTMVGVATTMAIHSCASIIITTGGN